MQKTISIAEGNTTSCRTRQPAKGLYEKLGFTNKYKCVLSNSPKWNLKQGVAPLIVLRKNCINIRKYLER
jgi:hypothetical protein